MPGLWRSRAQFGFTVAFHIVFPTFSIGLASLLMVLEGLWLRTGKHMVLASYLIVAFIVSGVAAWHLMRGRSTPAVRRMFSMANVTSADRRLWFVSTRRRR